MYASYCQLLQSRVLRFLSVEWFLSYHNLLYKSCASTVGCSVHATTTTTMSTTSQSRKGITQHPAPYDVGATWSSLGQSTALWYLGAMTTWTEDETDTSEQTTAQSVDTMTARRTSSSVTSNTTSNSTVASVRSTTKMPEQNLSRSASSPSTTSDGHAQPWCYIQ